MQKIAPQPLRIAHLTDLHLRHHLPGTVPNSTLLSHEILPLLREALIRIREEGATHLVLTGDLVDVPAFVRRPIGYYDEPVADFLVDAVADYQRLRETLDAGGIPYTLVPGSRDHYPSFFKVFPEAGRMVEVDGYRIVAYCDREWDAHAARRLDRERLRMETSLADPDSRPQIHVQHFLPWPRMKTACPVNYVESEEIAARYAASGNVVLSLSGCHHPGCGPEKHDGVVYSTAPAFGKPPFAYRLYSLDGRTVHTEERCLRDRPFFVGRKLAILDRDGVINTLPSYNTGPHAMQLIPGAGRAMLRLREAGFAVLILTNQSCIGMGYVVQETVDMNLDVLARLLVEEARNPEARADMIRYSTAAGERAVLPEDADTTLVKPSTAQVDEAVAQLQLDPSVIWFVGDRVSDLECARRLGAHFILVRTGDGEKTLAQLDIAGMNGWQVADHLEAAVVLILSS